MDENGSATPVGARESLVEIVKQDFAEARGRRMLGVIAVLLWLAFQWGWGNDILLPPIVTRSFDVVDDGDTWLSAVSAVLVGTGAGSLFWAVTQTLDVLIVLSGLHLVPRITERISQVVSRQDWIKPFAELSNGTRFLIAFASGASLLCLIDVFATGEPGLRSRVPMLVRAVALAVAGVAIAIVVVTATTAVGRRVPATAEAAEVVIRFARNPLTWLVIYGSLIGGSALIQHLARSAAPRP